MLVLEESPGSLVMVSHIFFENLWMSQFYLRARYLILFRISVKKDNYGAGLEVSWVLGS